MKIKKLSIFFVILFASILFSNKVSAIDISYCSYGETKLTLPVSVKVEITGFDSTNPFNTQKNYYYTDTLYVYDNKSCHSSLTLPYIENKSGLNVINTGYTSYYVAISYYYSYNNTWYKSNDVLRNGSFSTIDTTEPRISSSNPDLKVSMNTLLDHKTLSNYINAQDDNDGTLPIKITYDNYTSNYNIPGTYHLTYSACDYSNNCSNYTQKITVIDNIRPIIEGDTLIKSHMSNPLSLFQIANTLRAIDNYDGDLSSSIYLVESYYNLNKPGVYYALFDVKDNSNNNLLTPFKVTINYLDDVSPIIEGPIIFDSYLSSPLDTKHILSNLIASDNIDDNITNNLYIITDNYSTSKSKIGSYKIVVSCYDNSGNESIPYVLTINVKDDIKPIIEGNTNYLSYLSNPITINELKNKLISIDNHDGNITHKINIHDDNYSLNMDKIGVYYISFIVSDNSNNISDIFKIEITLVDDVLPIINGVNYYGVSTSEKLSISNITNSLTASDNIDGDISYKIILNEDNYSSFYNLAGTYYISYYVCDKSGNISLPFKIKIVVKESLTYIQSINKSLLYFDNQKLISDDEIFNILRIEKDKYLNIIVVNNTYKNNYSVVGSYSVNYEIENIDYTKEYLEINISVYESNEDEIDVNVYQTKKKETLLFYIVSFFRNFFINLPIFH